MILRPDVRALIALEDRRYFEGESFGATGTCVGEICFNTSMTGYQEVLTDPSCDPGSVIFETERGNLDASIETQLQEIERGLTDRLRRSQ